MQACYLWEPTATSAARVEDILTTAIPGFYMSPDADLALKRP
jgi:hypothetical protein